MTYIPKSQIAVKIADPGEFQFQMSREPFEGYYIETSKGIRYAGANNISLGPRIIPVETPSNKEHGIGTDVIKFDILKKSIKEFLSNTLPIPTMKRYPSEDDYLKGFFKRYFSRRINTTGYQEIDEEVFNSIRKKDKKYDHNLNEVGSIRWNLKGNVFKDNVLTLKTLERKWKNISYLFPLFDEFAREPFKNQENLHTEGEELYYGDSTEYIGAYHIHTTMGPMIGATHTEKNHPKLYYTDELPTPSNTSYEDFLLGYPPPHKISQLPHKKDINRDVNQPYVESLQTFNCIVAWGPPPQGHQGLKNTDGLVPVSSTCVNPGDGSGLYNFATYGTNVSQACSAQCEGSYINDTGGGIGCIMPWDPNYCSTCTTHNQPICAGNYGGSTTETCPCGIFNGQMVYSESCC